MPHQGGTNHVNEQPQSYWAAKFAAHGYRPADALRRRFWSDLEAGVVYSQNALLYVSEPAMRTMYGQVVEDIAAWRAGEAIRRIDG